GALQISCLQELGSQRIIVKRQLGIIQLVIWTPRTPRQSSKLDELKLNGLERRNHHGLGHQGWY
ncbi:hypothetical protein, partial [Pseudomonas graminis]|uniref:hypothetical protein n=1 Tax=Pseudomonas graminis TaxID=158627 RepID=UPI003C18AB58